MLRKLSLAGLVIYMLSGCGANQSKNERKITATCSDSGLYAHFIMNIIENNSNYLAPDFAEEYKLVYADNSYYSYKSNKVIKNKYKKDTADGFFGTKEIYDKELDLTLRVHRWGCGCELSLPNTIIYVSNNKDFEYGFLMADELRTRTNDTATEKHRPTGPSSLQFQINFMANAMHINILQTNKKILHLLSLITDSLLELKQVTVKDVPELEREKEAYHTKYSGQTDNTICNNCIESEMDQMISDLKANSGVELYYRSSTKYYPGFWKFDLVINTGKFYVNAVFNKCICGKLHA